MNRDLRCVTKLACSELSSLRSGTILVKLGGIPGLKLGALRSSHIGEFWNTTLRAKARGFNPSNVFVTKSQLFVLKHELLSVYQSLASFLSVFSQKQKVALWNC